MPPGFGGIDYRPTQQLFISGTAAMLAGGSFDIANYRSQNPNLKMDFIAPPAAKAGDRASVTMFFDGGYAVNAKSANKEAALKLVRYMGTKEFGDKFSALLGNISPIKGVAHRRSDAGPGGEAERDSAPHIMVVYFRFQEPTGSKLLQAAVQKMMAGR